LYHALPLDKPPNAVSVNPCGSCENKTYVYPDTTRAFAGIIIASVVNNPDVNEPPLPLLFIEVIVKVYDVFSVKPVNT
jgi:hypothetical protein